jgi:Domain of unknown function (DUF4132)
VEKGEFKGRKLSDIKPGAKLEDRDITGTPAEIAAARLEYVVKGVLLQGKSSDLEKETAAFATISRAPDEVRREVIKQLPALIHRLQPSPANAARVRAVQEKMLTAHPMLEPAITAETRVTQALVDINGNSFETWYVSNLIDVFTRDLPLEIMPHLMEALEKRIPVLEQESVVQRDNATRMRLETVMQRAAGLRRVKEGLVKQAQEMHELNQRLANASTPLERASAFVDEFMSRNALVHPTDYQTANALVGRARKAAAQLRPDVLQALTPIVLEELATVMPQVSVFGEGTLGFQKRTLDEMLAGRLGRELPFSSGESAALQDFLGRQYTFYPYRDPGTHFVNFMENMPVLSHAMASVLRRLIAQWPDIAKQELKSLATRVSFAELPLNVGELWTDTALKDLETNSQRAGWIALLTHANSSKSKPDAKWEKTALELLEKIPDFAALIGKWLPLVGKPRTLTLLEGNNLFDAYNANILRGLIWAVSLLEPTDAAARGLADVVLTSLRKVPGVGPRSPKIATAATFALGRMNSLFSVGQLARLKTRVTFKTTLKEIEKALDNAAQRQGMSKADLEELSIPTFGLEDVGKTDFEFGDVRAELRVKNSDVTLSWFDAKGKILKNPPAATKADYADELKDLKTVVKDVEGMLSAQSARLERFVLARKSWAYSDWRERYLEHGVVGCVARRLIWTFTHSGEVQNGIWHDGDIVDSSGRTLEIDPAATVTLWHPLDSSTERVLDWRAFLEGKEIVQPWKQAHREVYILTAAEERTDTYSNRFAAHILKQHQFNQLAALRGWRNQLRLMVDDTYNPAQLELPQWNLRAEYWVEGAGDDYGTDTTETGTYLYLRTDQVRFYRVDAPQNHAHAGGGGYEQWVQQGNDPTAPLRLETIPALVLSEVLRDVDLFVGVCSVGNDPAWNDGGPEGRYREYWQSYSFGELTDAAISRKALLEALVPRLKIKDVAEIKGKFLHVRGSLREYKIHMGSGNILMLPNDQYLCIVPGQGTANASSDVKLPFEGDRTLAVILSKAFMLADDKNIKDVTITRQIKG